MGYSNHSNNGKTLSLLTLFYLFVEKVLTDLEFNLKSSQAEGLGTKGD